MVKITTNFNNRVYSKYVPLHVFDKLLHSGKLVNVRCKWLILQKILMKLKFKLWLLRKLFGLKDHSLKPFIGAPEKRFNTTSNFPPPYTGRQTYKNPFEYGNS